MTNNQSKHQDSSQPVSEQQDSSKAKKNLIPKLADIQSQLQAKIQTQFANQVEAAKNMSQDFTPKIDQTLNDTQKNLGEKLENVDAWAIAQTNQVLEKGSESLESLKNQAQKKYEQTLEQATKQVSSGRDRLQNVAKNVMQSALDKMK
jgi:ElaB/YqjD/DUF883 family membrane-anchored ribosome-binding protein